MHLKLAFSYDPSDLFRVTAVVVDGRSHAPEPVVAQYRNEKVFYDLLLEADVDTETHARLVHAISSTITAPDSVTCCEDVEFSPEQLEVLRLDSVLSQRT
jgi:hypothetical protein